MTDKAFVLALVGLYAAFVVAFWLIRNHIEEIRSLRMRLERLDHNVVRLSEQLYRAFPEAREKKPTE